jgi:hypothetical protein
VVANPAASTLYVSGDTKEVKDVLKSLGLKWDGFELRWYGDIKKYGDVVAKLKEVADVEAVESRLLAAAAYVEKAARELHNLMDEFGDPTRPGPGRFKPPEDLTPEERERKRKYDKLAELVSELAGLASALRLMHKDWFEAKS